MSSFRIRKGNQEFPVADLAALIRLAQDGRLQAKDPLFDGVGWGPADRLPELRAYCQSDPWAIWDQSERLDADTIYQEALKGTTDAHELPVDAVIPLMVVENRPADIPALAPEPLEVLDIADVEPLSKPEEEEDEEEDVENADNTTGIFAIPPIRQAIALEKPKLSVVSSEHPEPRPVENRAPEPRPPMRKAPHPTEGAEVIPLPLPKPPPKTPRPEVRPEPRSDLPRLEPTPPSSLTVLRFITWFFLFVILFSVAWIGLKMMTATAPTPPGNISTPAPVGSPLAPVEQEIRDLLPKDPRPIQQAGDFTDILTIELQQEHLDVEHVDALITRWGGRHSDQPLSAEIRVTLRSSGEIEQELGAVGLVVGRYVHLYRLNISLFEVTLIKDDGAFRRNLNGEKADALYAGTLHLEQFLE
jgi:hypothetical protein